MNCKKELVARCLKKTTDRIAEIMHAIEQAQEAIENDTKSSAGDKYEISREMVQQDLNRYQTQLSQARKDKTILEQLPLERKEYVGLGTVIFTSAMAYFVAISIGQILLDQKTYMVISPSSPIGKLLMGKSVGGHIYFNGVSQELLAIS
ncbi:hypothetical protein [Sphingobacterium suaedae]|uniref:3-oxoacyl-ACP synthase n=1 Tax=Sphingobacterium suaedae TaxID=1686402 RepID=A0ABW5KFA1_9SPHI